MSRFIALAAAGLLASFVPVAPAMAHDGLEHLCHDADNNPVNDINECCYDPTVSGPTNVEGFPFCPAYLDRVAGGEQYATVDRTTLAHTHICPTGVDCGPPVELSNVKPFYGSTGSPAPLPPAQPVPAVAPQVVPVTPVAAAPTVITAPAAAAPAVYAPVGGVSSVGLGGSALVFGGLAAAGLAGIIALAASNDDDDAATATTN